MVKSKRKSMFDYVVFFSLIAVAIFCIHQVKKPITVESCKASFPNHFIYRANLALPTNNSPNTYKW